MSRRDKCRSIESKEMVSKRVWKGWLRAWGFSGGNDNILKWTVMMVHNSEYTKGHWNFYTSYVNAQKNLLKI